MRRGFILFKPDDTGNAGAATAGGGDAAGAAATAAAAGDAATAGSSDAGSTAAAAGAGAAGKTFTQAELDVIVAREKAKAEKKTKTDLEAEAQRAAMTETERLRAEKEASDKAAADAVKEANARVLRAEAKMSVLAAGAKPERVEHIVRLLDLSDIEVGDDGSVDAKLLAGAVAVLQKELPELFGGSAAQAARSGGDFSGAGGEGKRTWTRAEIAALAGTPAFEEHKEDINLAAVEGRIKD